MSNKNNGVSSRGTGGQQRYDANFHHGGEYGDSNRRPTSGPGSNGNNGNQPHDQELTWLKHDCAQIRNAVVLLEREKDNLRQAVRKLKLENGRLKEKVKKLQVDYDDLGRGDFILVGGANDPLSLRYEASIKDENGVEHKSAERFYWYKMAEKFGDHEMKQKIREAPRSQKAEELAKEIKGFDENVWNKVKLDVWQTAQRLKFEQIRWIANVLVETKNTYIAVASQDKVFGTGWRKNRDEANKTIFWDGQNEGGKWLMRYRKKLATDYQWKGDFEQEEAQKKVNECKRFVWRRIDPTRQVVPGRGGFRGGHQPQNQGGRRGGGNQMAYSPSGMGSF